MKASVLITSTSFLETPGTHLDRLAELDLDVLTARGPLSESDLLSIISEGDGFDGVICGNDAWTAKTLSAYSPRLKVLSKYGVGLEKIDMEAAQKLGIQVAFTPGINHISVSELTIGLIIALARQIPEQNALVHQLKWVRSTGMELAGKTLGIFGLGHLGREVAKRALAFGLSVLAVERAWGPDEELYVRDTVLAYGARVFKDIPATIDRASSDRFALEESDIIAICMSLDEQNQQYFSKERLAMCKPGVLIVNTARGRLVDPKAMREALDSGRVGGYAADVLDQEPVSAGHPLLNHPRVILTPHIGSRTTESVTKQSFLALDNLVRLLEGRECMNKVE